MSQTKVPVASDVSEDESRADSTKISTVTSDGIVCSPHLETLKDQSSDAVTNYSSEGWKDSETTMQINAEHFPMTENCGDMINQTLNVSSSHNNSQLVNITSEDDVDDTCVENFVSFIIESIIEQLVLPDQNYQESSNYCVQELNTCDIEDNDLHEIDQNCEKNTMCNSDMFSCCINANSKNKFVEDCMSDLNLVKRNLMNALNLSPVPTCKFNQTNLLPKQENESKQSRVHFNSQIATVFEYDVVTQPESDNSTDILSPPTSDDVLASQNTYTICDINKNDETDVTSLLKFDNNESNHDILMFESDTSDKSTMSVDESYVTACTNNDENILEDKNLCLLNEDGSEVKEAVQDAACEFKVVNTDSDEKAQCPFIEIKKKDELVIIKNDTIEETCLKEESKSSVDVEAINSVEDIDLVQSSLPFEYEGEKSSEHNDKEFVSDASPIEQELKYVAIPLPVNECIQYLLDNTRDKLDEDSNNTNVFVSAEMKCERDLTKSELINCTGNELFEKETIVTDFETCEERITIEENTDDTANLLENTVTQNEAYGFVDTSLIVESNSASVSGKRNLEAIPEEFNDNKRHKSLHLSCETNERKRQLCQDYSEGNIKVRKIHEVELPKKHNLDIKGPKMLRQLCLEKVSSLDDDIVWENNAINVDRKEESISQNNDLQIKDEGLKKISKGQTLIEDSSKQMMDNSNKEIFSKDLGTNTDDMVVPEMTSSDDATGAELNEEEEIAQTEKTLSQQNNITDEVISSGKFISATEYLSQCSQNSGSTGFNFDPVAKFTDICFCQSSKRHTNGLMVTCESEPESHNGREDEGSSVLLSEKSVTNVNTVVYEIDESDLTIEEVVPSKIMDNNINDEDKDERKLGTNDEDEQIDTDFLDVYVDKAVDQMVPNFENPTPKVYSCDADICDDEDISVCKPVSPPGTSPKADQHCFKWKYTPSCDQEMSPPELPDENQVVKITPLKTCGKPLRIGLSKRQPMKKSLHKIFRH